MSYKGKLPYVSGNQQTAWYIDTLTGLDTNAGDALNPLSSIAEMLRRVAPNGVWRPIGSITVNLVVGSAYFLPAVTYITDQGNVTWTIVIPPLVFDTFSAVTPRSAAGNVQPDATTTNPHGLVAGDIIRLQDDPSDTNIIAVVAVVIGPNDIGISFPIDAVTQTPGIEPVATNRYVKQPLVTVFLQGDQVASGNGTVIFRYLDLQTLTVGWTLRGSPIVPMACNLDVNLHEVGNQDGVIGLLPGCAIQGATISGTRCTITNCYVAFMQVGEGSSIVIGNTYLATTLSSAILLRRNSSVEVGGGIVCNTPVGAPFVLEGPESEGSSVMLSGGLNSIYGSGLHLFSVLNATVTSFRLVLGTTASNFASTGNDFLWPIWGNQFFPPLVGGAVVPAAAPIDNYIDFTGAPFGGVSARHTTQPVDIVGIPLCRLSDSSLPPIVSTSSGMTPAVRL